MSIFTNAKGIKLFQPRFINWSYLKRGNVQRINIKNNINPTAFAISTPTPMSENNQGATCKATQSIPGKLYPPKNKVLKITEVINILMYSANK